jgi:3'(2'), 5'-bisphosphate nucleotidase
MTTDVELAAAIAAEAGVLLLGLRASASGRELGVLGDRRSDELIAQRLRAARPEDAILSEESVDSPARLDAPRVWIVDPLDGTREYGIDGRTDWAVHVALWERGALTAAAVALPALGETYTSDPRRVATADGGSRKRAILVSESRPPSWASTVAEALGAALVPMGSAGAKAMAVVRGEYDAYVHDGGQWEWDSAAPVGVALAHGLHASRVDGSPLAYNQANPYLPDLLICRPELTSSLRAAIASAY